ncbi:MAG: FKBP-type peptidyl-prolyl cis-trans isomerase [Halapricum sp.]
MSRNTTTSEETFEPGEFVEIEYTARIVEDGTVVDTTDPSVAADSGLEGVGTGGSTVVILGEEHVFGPVEEAITEMRPDERRTVQVEPADAFGEQDPMGRRSIPVDVLAGGSVEQNDRVTIDGRVGYVDSVDGGTATVDFNHPLAGTTLEYELRTVDRVTGMSDRTAGLLGLYALEDDVSHAVADGVLECSVTRSSVPDGAWYERKRGFLETATEHLDIDAVRFEERYATP